MSETTPIEIWFQDEARIGQKNGLVRQWARRGTRPRQPADQRYDNAYLFGAICPARGVGAALALPYADTDMMQLHLDEISSNVAKGAHAVVLLDRAGWHITSKLDMPENITPIFLPSRAPELNPVENVWQYLRQNWISNTVFENYDAIVDAACDAWRKLTAQPETITSIGMRDWAHVGQSLCTQAKSPARKREFEQCDLKLNSARSVAEIMIVEAGRLPPIGVHSAMPDCGSERMAICPLLASLCSEQ